MAIQLVRCGAIFSIVTGVAVYAYSKKEHLRKIFTSYSSAWPLSPQRVQAKKTFCSVPDAIGALMFQFIGAEPSLRATCKEFDKLSKKTVVPIWEKQVLPYLAQSPLLTAYVDKLRLHLPEFPPHEKYKKLYTAMLKDYRALDLEAADAFAFQARKNHCVVSLEALQEMEKGIKNASLQKMWGRVHETLQGLGAQNLPSRYARAEQVEEWFNDPNNGAALGQVRSLDLSYLSLVVIPGQLRCFVNVETIDLNENSIFLLQENLFQGLQALRLLDLSHNQIAHLPEALLQGLQNLVMLHLPHNQIAHLPEALLQGLQNLSLLDLSHNQIAHLPEELLQGLQALRWLDLSHNQIAHLPEALLQGLQALLWLDLSHNQIAHLPEAFFQDNPALWWLHLSHNQIAAFPEALLQGVPNLRQLNLSHNQIAHLPRALLQSLPRLEKVFLSNAPYEVRNFWIRMIVSSLLAIGILYSFREWSPRFLAIRTVH